MRPVSRGPGVYSRYEDAKQDLADRLGCYCSYCERRIPTQLAVEHIQPKARPQYVHLVNEWTNFLLACANCNSAKGDYPVECDQLLLPDRDNTFAAFVYEETGMVEPAPGLGKHVYGLAVALRDLIGLNRLRCPDWDEATAFSALERISQRVQAWVQAKDARRDYEAGKTTARRIACEAAGAGFFSIWMAAFAGVEDVRRELIGIFPNTAADCFDQNTQAVSPRPDNGLAHGGKI